MRIELVNPPPPAPNGSVNIPTATFLRISSEWRHSDMSLAIHIWMYMISQASAGNLASVSADDLQHNALPQLNAPSRQPPSKTYTNSEVEQCMTRMVEFGLARYCDPS